MTKPINPAQHYQDDAFLLTQLNRLACVRVSKELPIREFPSSSHKAFVARLINLSRNNDFKIVTDNGEGCWIMLGAKSNKGTRPRIDYEDGRTTLGYRHMMATYLQSAHIPVAIHHQCRNTLCVRPDGKHCVPTEKNVHLALEAWLRDPELHPLEGVEGFMHYEAS